MPELPMTPPIIDDFNLANLPKVGKAPNHERPDPDADKGIPSQTELEAAHAQQFTEAAPSDLRNRVKAALRKAFKEDKQIDHAHDHDSKNADLRAGKLALSTKFFVGFSATPRST